MTVVDEMRALVYQLYGTFASGDPTVWTSRSADDVIGIGSDPDEWWEGRSAITSTVTAQVRETSTVGIRLVADDPRIHGHGDVVWSVDRPVLHLGDGAEIPMRVTLIAVVDAGTLSLKHFHYSVGAMNEEVFRHTLTTEEPQPG
ncbi:nuclear transport factor 2 family protein [Geodermatophilus sp. SYSU D01176]